jgi:hypothetical protein
MTKTLGVILIVLGLIGLIWGGVSYTTSKKVVDLGPLHASRDVRHSIPVPPIAGGILLAAGLVLTASGRR